MQIRRGADEAPFVCSPHPFGIAGFFVMKSKVLKTAQETRPQKQPGNSIYQD